MELLAAELERAKETHRQMEEAERRTPSEGRASATPKPARIESVPPARDRAAAAHPRGRRERTALKRPPIRGTDPSRSARRPAATRSSVEPPTYSAPGQARKDALLRGERDVVEQFSERDREERTSDAWASGERDAERGSTREAERVAALEVERSASLEAAPRRGKLQRAGIKESQQPLEATKRSAATPTTRSLDPRHLIGASPAELRRILVLQEVLGPPVGLRAEREE
jgi:hypothetical protein